MYSLRRTVTADLQPDCFKSSVTSRCYPGWRNPWLSTHGLIEALPPQPRSPALSTPCSALPLSQCSPVCARSKKKRCVCTSSAITELLYQAVVSVRLTVPYTKHWPEFWKPAKPVSQKACWPRRSLVALTAFLDDIALEDLHFAVLGLLG